MSYNSLKKKIEELVSHLKELSGNYELQKLKIEVVLHNKKDNKDITFKLNEKHDVLISSTSNDTSDTSDATEETENTLRSLPSVSSDNTLKTDIFKTDSDNLETETVESSEMAQSTTDQDYRPTAKNMELKGGFLKSKKN